MFWILNTAGWSGYGLAAYVGALAHEKPPSYMLVILFVAVMGFTLTIPLRYLYRWLWPRSPYHIAGGVIAASYLLGMIWRLGTNQAYLHWVEHDWKPTQFADYVSGVMGSFYILLCWSGLYFGIKYYQMLQDQTEKTLKATAAAHQAQLRMLRYQLNPHFLFNTLNAISTLILDNANETANRTVMRLSEFLRHTLDESDPSKLIPLQNELRALDLYLQIEKVRFGDRLIVERQIDDRALTALVPSLILQPLIENAIKYAVSPQEDGGTIRISCQSQGGRLKLAIADTGPGLQPQSLDRKPSCGVGLKNVRERLQYLYGDEHRFRLDDNQPKGLIVRIEIPLQIDE